MFLSVDTDNFDPLNIIISNKTKNNIMNNSDFLRICYSDEDMYTNGLYISFKLNKITIEKYFDKIKCNYQKCKKNDEIIDKILNIEKNILKKVCINNNIPIYRIEEQLKNNFIKIFPSTYQNLGSFNELHFLLKISGIWSTDSIKKRGLTFRFFIINKMLFL
jgi:hypothetical protein